jgi:site-specific DNA-cytosine methylase
MRWFVKAKRAQNNRDSESWIEGAVSPTLNVFDNKADTRATVLILENDRLRRLTPIECERLQGFPDNWTEGSTDTVRYEQMGNAVTVPVARWLIRRLLDLDK